MLVKINWVVRIKKNQIFFKQLIKMKEIIIFSIPKSKMDVRLEQANNELNCWDFWLINTVNKSKKLIGKNISTAIMTKVINNISSLK
jgi:hypothetical protein